MFWFSVILLKYIEKYHTSTQSTLKTEQMCCIALHSSSLTGPKLNADVNFEILVYDMNEELVSKQQENSWNKNRQTDSIFGIFSKTLKNAEKLSGARF